LAAQEGDKFMSQHFKGMVFGLAALGLVGVAQAASGAKYQVVESASESKIEFTSTAPLETIKGAASKLTGNVEIDTGNLAATKGSVELDVKSIKTNLELRDDHLAGPDWLDAAKHPKIKFEIGKVEGPAALKAGEAVDVKIHGKLSMHGVTRDEVATAKVRLTDKGVSVKADFKVSLPNYKVSVPSVVRLKVNDTIDLKVMLMVKPK
jgi:polyisoprenoid-binding protein YceI